MTRSELIQRIAQGFPHLTHQDTQLAVGHLLSAMAQALSEEKRIEIRGFGNFSVHHRPPRLGRNPKTGESVAVPGKRAPHFKPGKPLLEKLNVSPREGLPE